MKIYDDIRMLSVLESQENNKIADFSLNISKPNLSDSESSDEDIFINEIELDHNDKMKINRLRQFEEIGPGKEIKDPSDSKKGMSRTDQNDSICEPRELGTYNRLPHPEESKMEVDDRLMVETPKSYNLKNKQCRDSQVLRGSRQPSEKGFDDDLASERSEETPKISDKGLTGRKKRVKEMSEFQEQKKTRMSMKRQMEEENEVENKDLDQKVRSKRALKQPAKKGHKRKGEKIMGKSHNQEKSLQHLPGPSKGISGSDDSDSDESENEWEDVNGNNTLYFVSLFCVSFS